MPLAVFGLPVVATELPFDDDLLAFLGKRREVLSGLSPHGHVYESSDLLAFALAVAKELVVSDCCGGDRSPRVGFSQGWTSDQVATDDDAIDVHSNMRVFLVVWLNGCRRFGYSHLPFLPFSPGILGFRLGEKK